MYSIHSSPLPVIIPLFALLPPVTEIVGDGVDDGDRLSTFNCAPPGKDVLPEVGNIPPLSCIMTVVEGNENAVVDTFCATMFGPRPVSSNL